ncbi:uncharacterized protein LOC143145215 [Ptiloglossa arizonensis]|uniref:uncharacterized protein LOC143145215 n=1 Tax=Ptiloglossa arizonensis TaxID=3350558 RepID=UPI003F9EC97C
MWWIARETRRISTGTYGETRGPWKAVVLLVVGGSDLDRPTYLARTFRRAYRVEKDISEPGQWRFVRLHKRDSFVESFYPYLEDLSIPIIEVYFHFEAPVRGKFPGIDSRFEVYSIGLLHSIHGRF